MNLPPELAGTYTKGLRPHAAEDEAPEITYDGFAGMSLRGLFDSQRVAISKLHDNARTRTVENPLVDLGAETFRVYAPIANELRRPFRAGLLMKVRAQSDSPLALREPAACACPSLSSRRLTHGHARAHGRRRRTWGCQSSPWLT